jgi:prepilin-type N-terminal cleavage/methylation domain-containing protein
MKTTSLKQRGFTLLEILIAVTIFSGIIILAMGAFARSADSSVRSSAVRQKSEAARSIVDQVSNDFRYLYTDTSLIVNQDASRADGCYLPGGSVSTSIKGFRINSLLNCVEMILHYPRSTNLVKKVYKQENLGGHLTLTLQEQRDCTNNGGILACPEPSSPQDLLSEKFVLNQDATIFSGNDFLASESGPVVTSPFLEMAVSIKRADSAAQSCSEDVSLCYTITTTVTTGGSN